MDEYLQLTHRQMADSAAVLLIELGTLGMRLVPERIDFAFLPCMQSGGVYDLTPGNKADHRNLEVCA